MDDEDVLGLVVPICLSSDAIFKMKLPLLLRVIIIDGIFDGCSHSQRLSIYQHCHYSLSQDLSKLRSNRVKLGEFVKIFKFCLLRLPQESPRVSQRGLFTLDFVVTVYERLVVPFRSAFDDVRQVANRQIKREVNARK